MASVLKAALALSLLLVCAHAAWSEPVPLRSNKQNDSTQACVVNYNSCLTSACSGRGGSPHLEENATGYTFTCSFNSSADDTVFYGGDRWGDVYDCRQALGECALNANPGLATKVCGPSFLLALLLFLTISSRG